MIMATAPILPIMERATRHIIRYSYITPTYWKQTENIIFPNTLTNHLVWCLWSNWFSANYLSTRYWMKYTHLDRLCFNLANSFFQQLQEKFTSRAIVFPIHFTTEKIRLHNISILLLENFITQGNIRRIMTVKTKKLEPNRFTSLGTLHTFRNGFTIR